MATFSLAAHSSHNVLDALLAPGTQWSQNPIESLPAACAPRTYGIARIDAAVVARNRRRVNLLLRMMQSSLGSHSGAAEFCATGFDCRWRLVWLHAVTGRKLRSNSPRVSVEICAPNSNCWLGHRGVLRDGGKRDRPAVEPQGQAEGRAAAAQEGGERRRHDLVAALSKFGPQAPPAAGHDQRAADPDGIGGKATAILDGDLDPLMRCDALADCLPPDGGEGVRQIHDFAAGQRCERGVDVVEAGVREFECDDVLPEHV